MPSGLAAPLLGLALLAAAAPLRCRAAFFLLEEGTERCFTEDVLEHQVMRVEYTMHIKDVRRQDEQTPDGERRNGERQTCSIFVKDPTEKVIKEHAVESDTNEGALALATQMEGRHHVCLLCPAQEWFGTKRKHRWTIKFDVLGTSGLGGEPDPKKFASFNRLKTSKDNIDDAMSRLYAIYMENQNQKYVEVRFVRTSEAVNLDVSAFKVVQILLIAAATAFQLHHMTRFLKRSHLDCMSCLPMRSKPVL